MHWSAYETFSVISGLTFVAIALIPDTPMKDRAWSVLAGLGLIAYAMYVAEQDSGTYYFPVGVFVIPFAMAVLMVVKAIDRRQRVAPAPLPPTRPGDRA